MTVREFRLIMIITFVVTNAINFLVLPKETSASTETQQFNGVLDARSTQYFVIERSSEEPISIRATSFQTYAYSANNGAAFHFQSGEETHSSYEENKDSDIPGILHVFDGILAANNLIPIEDVPVSFTLQSNEVFQVTVVTQHEEAHMVFFFLSVALLGALWIFIPSHLFPEQTVRKEKDVS